MNVIRYRFGPWLLDPRARELLRDGERETLPVSHLDCLVYLIQNRDRPVGRDELAAAVWDRVDVSEVSVNHAIMGLRRRLGDTGSEQQAIRTLPRVGYRWILPVTEELETEAPAPIVGDADPAAIKAAPAEAVSAEPVRAGDHQATPTTTSAAGRPSTRRRWLVAMPVLAAMVMAGAWWLADWRSQPDHARLQADEAASAAALADDADMEPIAMVLPAITRASGDWTWLRLGLMALVGDRLREDGLAVTPSETVVGLVTAVGLEDRVDVWPGAELSTRGTVMVRPEVSQLDGRWSVRLHVREDDTLHMVEASDRDVLAAARQAADSLAVRRGLAPAITRDGATDQHAEQVAQRIQAAVLAGQLDIARQLIAQSPEDIRSRREIVLSQAAVDFFSGDYPASIDAVEALLGVWEDNDQPRLKARALYQLGASYTRQRRLEDSRQAFEKVIELITPLTDPHQLASAYTGLGVIAGMQTRLDDATRLLGQARALHHMGNDAFGVARVDLNLAALAMDRGQAATALEILQKVVGQLEVLNIPEARIYALRAMQDAQLMLLQVPEALATSERFWPADQHSDNARERWWLYQSRAVALTAAGHLTEASSLVEELLRHSDPVEDQFVRTEAEALRASIALFRGDNDGAASAALKALTPVLEDANRLGHATTWLTRIRALHRAGRVEEAAGDVRRMRDWAVGQPQDWRRLYVILAEAEQHHAEGSLDDALAGYDQAMAVAETVAIPENLVVIGESWIDALIHTGQLERASAISGRLSLWADRDWRAAWAQARLYQAMDSADQARRLTTRAKALAGERILPERLFPLD